MSLQNFFNSLTGNGINKKNGAGETRLYEAARAGNLGEVKKLIRSGADVDARDVLGLTALHQAAYWGETMIVKALLDAGADASAATPDGWTPLHSAALAGGMKSRSDVIKILKAHDAKDDTPDKHGWTAADYMKLWVQNPPAAAKLQSVIAAELGKNTPALPGEPKPAEPKPNDNGIKIPNALKPFFPKH